MSSDKPLPAGSRKEPDEPKWLTTVAGAGGVKGQSGAGASAEEDPDTLQSKAWARVLDVISEGPIEGWAHPNNPLSDIYLDNTPIENPDEIGGWGQQHDGHTTNGSKTFQVPNDLFPLGPGGKENKSAIVGRWIVGDFLPWGTQVESVQTKRKLTMTQAANGGTGSYNQDWKLGGTLNFRNFNFQFRNGSQNQGFMNGFPAAENTIPIQVQITKKPNPGPWIHQFGDLNLDAIRIDIRYPILQKQNTSTGDIHGTAVQIEILVNNTMAVDHIAGNVEGKSSGPYVRTFKIELSNYPPGAGGWTIEVRRYTDDSKHQELRNETWVDSVTEVIYGKLRFPNTAYVGLKMDSRHFSQIPTRAYKIKGLRIKIPSNYDPVTRTYTGTWDGTFAAGLKWTDNPAWCFYDMATNNRYGLGHFLIESHIDKWTLYQIGKYCDQLVPNGKGGTEPRFSCNLYIQRHEDAIKVLQDMAGIFRGMLCYINGAVTPVQDAPTDPSAYRMFSPANVLNGAFSYSGTGMRARHNVALVSWSDLKDSGKMKQEYVEDHEGITRQGGITQLEMTGFGCTSRAQARRIGLWAIYAEKMLTDTVSFATALEGYFLKPGQLIQVQDPFRAGANWSGRVKIGSTGTHLYLDRSITLTGGHEYWVSILNPTTNLLITKAVTQAAGTWSDINVAAFGFNPDPDSLFQIADLTGAKDVLVPQLFRVFSLVQKDESTIEISALEYNKSLYDFVDFDHPLEDPPISILPGAEQTKPPRPPLETATIQVLLPDHTIRQDLEIAWIATLDLFLRSYAVRWRLNSGNWHTITEIEQPNYRLRAVQPGHYDLQILAINTIGVWSLPLEGGATVPVPPTRITGVAGLELFGGNDYVPGTERAIFQTRDAHFTWRGTNGSGNGPNFFTEENLESGLPDPMARGFLVRIYNDDDMLWQETTAQSEYTYTWDRNRQETEERYGAGTGPLRIFRIEVHVVFTDNTLSDPARLTVENLRPPPPRDVTTQTGNGFIAWQWSPPGAPDIDHYGLFASLNHEDPDPPEVAEFYGTWGQYFTQPGGPWYYWLGTVDSFGNVSSNVPQGPPPGGIVQKPRFVPAPGSYQAARYIQIIEDTPGCTLTYALVPIGTPATQWYLYPGGTGVWVEGHKTLHAQATQNVPPFEVALKQGNYHMAQGGPPPPPPPQPPGPPNDDFADFIAIPAIRQHVTPIHGTTVNADTEPSEYSTAPEGINRTVWYRWNTMDPGIFVGFWGWGTGGTNALVIEAFTGPNVSSLTRVARSDAEGILWFRQPAVATAYWIRVRPASASAGLDFSLAWWTATCSTPNFDPPGGFFAVDWPTRRLTVDMRTETPDAVMYWAFGRDPTTADYDGWINRTFYQHTLNEGAYDIRAIAVRDGFLTSTVGVGQFLIEQKLGPPCEAPTFIPPSGTTVERFPIQVQINCAEPAASVIRYTKNGQIPGRGGPGTTIPNHASVTMDNPGYLKAVAYTRGREESRVAIARYRLSGRTPAPTFAPGPGQFTSFPIAVTISVPIQPNLKIRYTTNGDIPSETVGTLIDGTEGIATITAPGTTLKAISYGTGYINSAVTSGLYTGKVPTPTHTPDGFYYPSGDTVPVTIIFDPPAVGVTVNMRYTTNGDPPTRNKGTLVTTSPAIVNISGGYRELRSIAYVPSAPDVPAGPNSAGGYDDSDVKLSIFDYLIILPPPNP